MGLLNKMNPETIEKHKERAQQVINNPQKF